ncbi:hypothetical protein LBMAG10_15600 [Actinomycetes bacterium]|nr:hypothetical protein LBMAG10_15600 [Actinomycetes bacterium]
MNTQPGWFPDPSDPNVEVFFDGESWTGEKRAKTQNTEKTDKSKEISFSLPISPNFFSKKRILIGVGILVLAIAGTTFANFQSEKAAKEARVQAAVERAENEAAELAAEAKRIRDERADYSWVPSGYSKFSMNNNMAWKKIGYDAADCYGDCLGMLVISRDYCDSIRIEGNVVRNGVILESNSDFASDIPAKTPTIMKMAGSFSGTVQFTKAECT